MKEFFKLLKSVREYKRAAILTILSMVLEVAMEVLIPLTMSKLVDQIENNTSSVDGIWKYAILLVAMALISMFGGFMGGFLGAKASTGFAKNLRKDVFDNIQTFSFENIDKFSSSSLVTRLTTDVVNAQNSFQMSIRIIIRAPLMFIFSIIMAFILGGSMALAFVVVIPLLLVGLLLVFKKVSPIFKKVFKKYDNLNESVQENVSGIRVVKSYVREDYEREKFNNASEDITKDFIKAEKIMALTSPIMNFAIYFIIIFVFGFGSYLILTTFIGFNDVEDPIYGALSTGQLSAILTYGMQILHSFMIFAGVIVMFTMSLESMRRINEVLEEKSTLSNPKNPVYEVKDGSFEFKNVSFKYFKDAKKYALENINVKIKSGSIVGVIGSTGSGKTTFVNLISRLYDVTKGEILVGGVNVKDYDLVTLRDKVSVVLQKNVLFSGTIASNLKWGNENATLDEIKKACKIACADEFIEQFNDKYDTYIEQGGTNVSGGQKQRLCIARALLKQPKIIILDDSTSAVDTKTDSIIRDGFKSYIPDTTKIIVAQRISSIENADVVIVLDNGKINAIGTNEELLKNNKIYQEVYYSQNKNVVKEGDK